MKETIKIRLKPGNFNKDKGCRQAEPGSPSSKRSRIHPVRCKAKHRTTWTPSINPVCL